MAVETAVLTPAILLMMAGLTDFGDAARHGMALTSAVRSGAQYAIHNSANESLVQTAVVGALTGDTSQVTVTVSQVCECNDGTSVSCTGACTSGARRVFIDINAQRPHATLMTWPGIANPTTLTAFARVRIQ